MRAPAIIAAIAVLLLAVPLLAVPAAAQTAAPLAGGVVNSSPDQRVIVTRSGGLVEAAVASCAGGAMIGYLAVLATGAPTPFATAALFCGLSVAATTASNVAAWTWDTVTAPLR